MHVCHVMSCAFVSDDSRLVAAMGFALRTQCLVCIPLVTGFLGEPEAPATLYVVTDVSPVRLPFIVCAEGGICDYSIWAYNAHLPRIAFHMYRASNECISA